MASIRSRMIGVALFVVALSALEAIKWDGGPADRTNIAACVGSIASIPWSFVKGDGETLLSLAWSFQAPGKVKTEIATWQNGHFYTTEERFGFLPNAGLSLHDARPQDSGDFSVKVQFQQADSSLVSSETMVTLSVSDSPPATQDGDLHITLSDVVRDDVTEDWTVRLYCGHFVDLGHPPVDVVWTTPSGEVTNSSYDDNGTFVLSVSTYDQGGNYSCHLPSSAPAVRCLTATSPLNAAAQLDDKDVRLTLLEAQLQETKAQQQETKAELQKTKAQLQGKKAQQQETKAELQKTKAQLQETNAQLQETKAQQQETKGELQETKAQLQETKAQQQETKGELQETKAQLQETNVQLQETKAQQQETKGELQETKAQLQETKTQLQDFNRTVDFTFKREMSSCVDWFAVNPQSGVRTIQVSGQSMTVYCDQVTDYGGWTVFQRRKNASVDFYRVWTDYLNGFGDLEGNFWLGLDKLHSLTTSQRFELRVDLHTWDGITGYATYSGFYVDDASKNFTLHLDKFTGGNVGESLIYHKGCQFSTKDRDNDLWMASCAEYFLGAWWYRACYFSNLNGDYKPNGSAPHQDGINWYTITGSRVYSLKFSEMKIRPL